MSAPMTMDEWQRRMKQQKEQERRKKTESAEVLRGYRGGVSDEDMKLAALRQEERKKHLDAERILHNYRGKDIPEELKRPARKSDEQHPYPPVNLDRAQDPLELIQAGLVSSKAANFDAKPGDNTPPSSHSTGFHTHQQTGFFPDTADENKQMDGSNSRDVDHKQEDSATVNPTPMPASIPPEPMVPPVDHSSSVPSEAHFMAPPPVEAPLMPSFNGYVADGLQPEPECSEVEPDVVNQVDHINGNYGDVAAVVEDEPYANNEEEELGDDEEAGEAAENQEGAQSDLQDKPLRGHPTVVRLDVLFSFGLVTLSGKPSLDGYMLAVEEVVKITLDLKPALAKNISYDPAFCPFVKSCDWDDGYVDQQGRPRVRRALVTAAVPVFLKNGISVGHARESIVASLQSSIQSGAFLQLAQGVIL